MEGFLNKERILTHNFDERKITLPSSKISESATALCPEYEMNYALYNQLFTGADFAVKTSTNQLK
jgi:hypothetical protein